MLSSGTITAPFLFFLTTSLSLIKIICIEIILSRNHLLTRKKPSNLHDKAHCFCCPGLLNKITEFIIWMCRKRHRGKQKLCTRFLWKQDSTQFLETNVSVYIQKILIYFHINSSKAKMFYLDYPWRQFIFPKQIFKILHMWSIFTNEAEG